MLFRSEGDKLQITVPNGAFVEDEDGMLTGVVAEMMAYMEIGRASCRERV